MGRAYFIVNIKPNKMKLMFHTRPKILGVYAVKKVEWVKRPYFVMKEKQVKKKVEVSPKKSF